MHFKFNFKLVLLLSFAGFLTTSCTRDTGGESKLSFAMPTNAPLFKAKSLGKVNATEFIPGVLVHVEVAVHTGGFPRTFSFDSDCKCAEDIDLPPPSQIILDDMPNSGTHLVQFLGVYENPETEELIFSYDDALVTFTSGDNVVEMRPSALATGSGTEGKVVGRYLTAAGVGPTGKVAGLILPPGKPAMPVLDFEIFGGWFSFFIIDGVNFQYVTETGEILFPALGFNSAEVAVSDSVVRVSAPERFSANGSNDGEEDEFLAMGFFGPANTAANKVCFDGNTAAISGAKQQDNSTQLVWHPNNDGGVNNVNRLGGGVVEDGAHSTQCTTNSSLYVNHMNLDEQLLGDNVDRAAGVLGPFRALSGSNFVTDSISGGNVTLTWDYLPGVFSGPGAMTGVSIFQIADANVPEGLVFTDERGVNCDNLESIGYIFRGDRFGDAQDSFVFPDNGVTPTNGDTPKYVICPFRGSGAQKEFFTTALEVREFGSSGGLNLQLSFEASGGGDLQVTADQGTSECVDIDLLSVNAAGVETPVNNSSTVNLSDFVENGSTNGQFFSGAGCGGIITSVVFAPGESKKTISYRATQNDYYNIQAFGTSGGDISGSDGHIIGYVSGAATQLRVSLPEATLDSGGNALIVQNQCYLMEVRALNASNRPALYAANPDLTFTNPSITAQFFTTEDCQGGTVATLNQNDGDHTVFMSMKVTAGSSGSIDAASGGLTASSLNLTIGDNTIAAYKLASFENEFNPGLCERMFVEPVNSVGAPIEVGTQKNLTITSPSSTGLHDFGDCSDGAKASVNVEIDLGKDGTEFFMKTSSLEYEALFDVTDGGVTSVNLLAIPKTPSTGVPFANKRIDTLSINSASGLGNVIDTTSGSGHDTDNNPANFALLTVDATLDPSASGSRALFIHAHEIDFTVATTMTANGLDGTAGSGSFGGNGGDGASGGGGGGDSGGNGGDGGTSVSGDPVTGTTPGTGGSSFVDYIGTGSATFTYPNGGSGANGGDDNASATHFGGNAFGPLEGAGAGGGGGAGTNGGPVFGGGGGGGGGGMIVLVANKISSSTAGTTLDVSGGNGGNGTFDGPTGNPDSGVGGGGGGGVIVIYAREYDGSLVCDVSAGANGSVGETSGTTSATAGTVELHKINSDNTTTPQGSSCSTSWTAN